jgi:hypothetical protein
LLFQIVLAFLRNIVAVRHLVGARLIFSDRFGEPQQANFMPFQKRRSKNQLSHSSLPGLVQSQGSHQKMVNFRCKPTVTVQKNASCIALLMRSTDGAAAICSFDNDIACQLQP